MPIKLGAALVAGVGVALASLPALATPPAKPDEIAAFSTKFATKDALKGWTEHKVDGFSRKWAEPKVENNALVLTPTSSGWFEDMQAGHLYREIDGNFVVTTRVRVDGTKQAVPQRSFSLAGLFIRSPRSGLTAANWEPKKENWMFFSTGTAFPAGTRQFEIKTTYNSISTLKISAAPEGWINLRIVRHGELFTLLHKADAAKEWTVLDQFIRPDLPTKLNVGITAYADWDSAAPIYPDFVKYNTSAPAMNGDLVARFESVSFRRPTVDRFPIATLDPAISFMPDVSQKRLVDLKAD